MIQDNPGRIYNFAPRYREGEIVVVDNRGLTHRLNENSTGAERTDILKFTAEMKSTDLPSMREAKVAQLERGAQEKQPWEPWHNRDMTKMEEALSRIHEAAERGGVSAAADLHAEGITLARVDKAGKEAVDAEIKREFENARLQDIRQGTNNAWMRPALLKEGQLVAVTRSGGVYRINPRFVETDRLERAATGNQTPTLSAAREYFATERQQQKDDRQAVRETLKDAEQTQRGQDYTMNAIKRAPGEAIGNIKDAAFKVVDTAGRFMFLANFVESLFDSGRDQNAQDPPNRSEGMSGNHREAMEDIYEQYQRNQALPAESIRNLPLANLEDLRRNGDAGMHMLIRNFEIEKENEVAQSWAEYDHDRIGGGRER